MLTKGESFEEIAEHIVKEPKRQGSLRQMGYLFTAYRFMGIELWRTRSALKKQPSI